MLSAYPVKYADGHEQYHEGFRAQAASWPENPLDLFIARIKAKRPASIKGKPPLQVADMGCGDARLAKTLDDGSGCEHVSSFDLAKNGNPYITRACSMQDTQLPDNSMDVVLFCLSLMGTDWIAFVEEAVRILKKTKEAEVWVAEVKSRFETTERAKFTELSSFIKACEACGLRLVEQVSFASIRFQSVDTDCFTGGQEQNVHPFPLRRRAIQSGNA